jgi:hypothetical protein
MEDASGIDLDWFWRGWFYSTDHADQAIDGVKLYRVDTRNPELEKPIEKKERDGAPQSLSDARNEALPKRVDLEPALKDFYNEYDALDVHPADRKRYEELVQKLDQREKDLVSTAANFYIVTIRNLGGLVMPVIMKVDYTDKSSEEIRIPAEIWRRNSAVVEKMIVSTKDIAAITLDPHLEIADTDLSNNAFPRVIARSRFQLFKQEKLKNPMQELEKKPGPDGRPDEGR